MNGVARLRPGPRQRPVHAESLQPAVGHLERLQASGLFAWCREVALASTDRGNTARFVGLLKSQGDYQALRRHGLDDTDIGVDRFERLVHDRLGDDLRPWRFVYRARLAFAP